MKVPILLCLFLVAGLHCSHQVFAKSDYSAVAKRQMADKKPAVGEELVNKVKTAEDNFIERNDTSVDKEIRRENTNEENVGAHEAEEDSENRTRTKKSINKKKKEGRQKKRNIETSTADLNSARHERELEYDRGTGNIWAVVVPPRTKPPPNLNDEDTQSSLRFIRDMAKELIDHKREFFERVAKLDRNTRRPMFENLMVAAQADCNGQYKEYVEEYARKYWNFPSMGELPCLIDGFHHYEDPKTSFTVFLQEMKTFYYLYLPQYIYNIEAIQDAYKNAGKFVVNFKEIKELLTEILGVVGDTFIPNRDESLRTAWRPIIGSSHSMRFIMLTIIEMVNGLTYLQNRVEHYIGQVQYQTVNG